MKHLLGLTSFFIFFNVSLCDIILPHQGRVSVSGNYFSGVGYFRYALVSTSGELVWNHEGNSGKPTTNIPVNVNNGFFNVDLGDENIDGMGALESSTFSQHSGLKLRIWFSDGSGTEEQLLGDQSLPVAPYSITTSMSGRMNISSDFGDPEIHYNSYMNILTRDSDGTKYYIDLETQATFNFYNTDHRVETIKVANFENDQVYELKIPVDSMSTGAIVSTNTDLGLYDSLNKIYHSWGDLSGYYFWNESASTLKMGGIDSVIYGLSAYCVLSMGDGLITTVTFIVPAASNINFDISNTSSTNNQITDILPDKTERDKGKAYLQVLINSMTAKKI